MDSFGKDEKEEEELSELSELSSDEEESDWSELSELESDDEEELPVPTSKGKGKADQNPALPPRPPRSHSQQLSTLFYPFGRRPRSPSPTPSSPSSDPDPSPSTLTRPLPRFRASLDPRNLRFVGDTSTVALAHKAARAEKVLKSEKRRLEKELATSKTNQLEERRLRLMQQHLECTLVPYPHDVGDARARRERNRIKMEKRELRERKEEARAEERKRKRREKRKAQSWLDGGERKEWEKRWKEERREVWCVCREPASGKVRLFRSFFLSCGEGKLMNDMLADGGVRSRP